MSADPQVFLKTEYGYPAGYAPASESVELAENAKASVWHITTLFECFWSFYEAMRVGRPLPNANEKLHQMGNALRNITRHD